MKIREIERTANVAWSPASISPAYLVCGTAAQHIDLNFSSSCALEIFELDVRSDDFVLKPTGSVQTDHRYNEIVWGSFGDSQSLGTIATGCDNGLLEIYSASSILAGDSTPLQTNTKHVGTINAMDFNPFQANLLASGASESEIFMWDLEKPGEYTTPGSKSQPQDDVTALAWNRQAQPILASGFSSRVLIWDFRKNEAILKLAESSRVRCKSIAWHPEAALQLAVASEDDHMPVIQIWDLRYAAAPLRSLEGHSSGVLSISWCQQDPDLLVSNGKDDRVLLWNPNSASPSGEIVAELQAEKWCFDVQFCPSNPALVSVADFNGKVGIYSIMGGVATVEQQVSHASSNAFRGPPSRRPSVDYSDVTSPVRYFRTQNQIADSFPGMEGFALPQVPTQQYVETVSRPPTKAPKWMKTPCRPSFSFGGKLLTGEEHVQQGQLHRNVRIYQVTTDHEMVENSMIFANAFTAGDMLNYCEAKVGTSKSASEANVWLLIRSHFVQDPRHDQIQVLGYSQEAVAAKVDHVLGRPVAANTVDVLTNGFGDLVTQERPDDYSHLNGSDAFDALSLSSRRTPDVVATKSATPDIAGSKTPDSEASTKRLRIPTDDSSDGLISQALVTGNLVAAVDLCTKDERWADALILSMSGGPELLAATQQKYFKSASSDVSRMIGGIVSREWSSVSSLCDLSSWKEVVATSIMFGTAEEVRTVCQTLAERLESEKGGSRIIDAAQCYILAGNLDALVRCWESQNSGSVDNATLQEFVEQLMVIQKALQMRGYQGAQLPVLAADKISSYANLLASEGQLELALMLLGNLDESELPDLRMRLEHATGQRQQVKRATTSRRVSGPTKPTVVRQPSLPHPASAQQQSSMYTPAPQQQPSMFSPSQQQPGAMFTPSAQQPFGQPQQSFAPVAYPPTQPFSQQSAPARPPSRPGFGIATPMTAFQPSASVAPPPVTATPPPSGAPVAAGSRRPRIPDPNLSSGYTSSFGTAPSQPMFTPSAQMQPSFTGFPTQQDSHQYGTGAPPQNQYAPSDPYQPANPATPQPPLAPLRDEHKGWNDPPAMTSSGRAKVKPRRPAAAEATPVPFQPAHGQSAPTMDPYGSLPDPYQSQQSAYQPQPNAYQPQSGYGGQAGNAGYGAIQQPGGTYQQQGYSSPMSQQTPVAAQHSYGATSQQTVAPPTMPVAPTIYGQLTHAPPVAQSFSAQPPAVAPSSANIQSQPFSQNFGGAVQQPYNVQPVQPVAQPQSQSYQQQFIQQGSQLTTEAEYGTEAIEKPAIPAEHAALFEVIEELRQRVTAAVATAAPMKRKLDEVARKMELLYDKLRNNDLSPSVLDLLYRIVEAVKSGDYATALGLHQQMTSTGSYGEIGNFMPSLKVLLQLAPQNGIYLR